MPNPYALAALATAAVPRLDVVAVGIDHVGADFTFAVAQDAQGRRWVVRVPRHAAAAAGQKVELKLLDALRDTAKGATLPFEVARPQGSAQTAAGQTAIVYPAPPGQPLDVAELEPGPGLAASVGRAIGALHQLPPTLAAETGMPVVGPPAYLRHLKGEVEQAASTGHVPTRLTARWRANLAKTEMWAFDPVLIHGDMAPEHILADSGRVTALLDLAGAQVSDPAEDLAPLLAASPPEVAETIVEAYRSRRGELDDRFLEQRAAMLAEIAVIRWLAHGVSHGDKAIIDDARDMLADLDQAVEAEEREARLMAQAQAEAQARQAAAARASAAAARQRERAFGAATPQGGEAKPDAKPDTEAEPGKGAKPGGGEPGDADPAEDHLTALMSPPRRKATARGVDMWGHQAGPGPASWDDPELMAAAATPPPGADGEGQPDAKPGPGKKAGPGAMPDDGARPGGKTAARPLSPEEHESVQTQAFLPDFLRDDLPEPEK
jgi:aminoglycoside phosphotransferase (APT) family kinase protein